MDTVDKTEQLAELTALRERLAFLEALPRVTAMMLCDFAQVDASGKLSVIGGGWSLTDARRPCAIVISIRVPPQAADRSHALSLALVDEHGRQVLGDNGEPVGGALSFTACRTPLSPPAAPLYSNLAVSVPALPLRPGGTYTWQVAIDGEPSASASFSVLAGS